MIQIAIDGPAGAGKSTIAKRISKELNINYLDTGAMYRAIAYQLIQQGISVNDSDKVVSTIPNIQIEVKYINGEQHVFANDEDITSKIRTPEISKAASDVAVIPEVRIKLVELQREVANQYNVIMDGRDIGTYVLPNAKVKIFLVATVEERARRRLKDLNDIGVTKELKDLIEEISSRDKTDSSRAFAPLKQADDAVLLDTTDLSIDEVVNQISKIIYEAYPNVL